SPPRSAIGAAVRASSTSTASSRIASSWLAPPARKAAYSSSRCWRISWLICRGHSGMFHPGDAADRPGELAPGAALRGQHLRAGRGQAVIAAPALAGLLDPAALDPAALLEAVEQRIEGGDAELQHAARSRFDQLAQVVAVSRLILDQRKNQELGAPLLELAIEHPRLDMFHSDILLKRISRVNPGRRAVTCRHARPA